jgi:hypothetical protein
MYTLRRLWEIVEKNGVLSTKEGTPLSFERTKQGCVPRRNFAPHIMISNGCARHSHRLTICIQEENIMYG